MKAILKNHILFYRFDYHILTIINFEITLYVTLKLHGHTL